MMVRVRRHRSGCVTPECFVGVPPRTTQRVRQTHVAKNKMTRHAELWQVIGVFQFPVGRLRPDRNARQRDQAARWQQAMSVRDCPVSEWVIPAKSNFAERGAGVWSGVRPSLLSCNGMFVESLSTAAFAVCQTHTTSAANFHRRPNLHRSVSSSRSVWFGPIESALNPEYGTAESGPQVAKNRLWTFLVLPRFSLRISSV
jgi:hypothetical protein